MAVHRCLFFGLHAFAYEYRDPGGGVDQSDDDVLGCPDHQTQHTHEGRQETGPDPMHALLDEPVAEVDWPESDWKNHVMMTRNSNVPYPVGSSWRRERER